MEEINTYCQYLLRFQRKIEIRLCWPFLVFLTLSLSVYLSLFFSLYLFLYLSAPWRLSLCACTRLYFGLPSFPKIEINISEFKFIRPSHCRGGVGGGSVWDPHNLCLAGRRSPKQPSKEVQVNNLWLRLNRKCLAHHFIPALSVAFPLLSLTPFSMFLFFPAKSQNCLQSIRKQKISGGLDFRDSWCILW